MSDTSLNVQQLDFTAPEDFARADIFAFKNNGSATFFVDDFSLAEVGSEETIAVEDNEVVEAEDSDVSVTDTENTENVEVEDNNVTEVEDNEVVVEEGSDVPEDNSDSTAVKADAEAETEPFASTTITVDNSSFTDELTGWNSAGENISVVERSHGDRWVEIGSAIGGIEQDVSDQMVAGEDYQISATTQLGESGTNGYVGVGFITESNKLIDLQYIRVTGNTSLDFQQLDFTAPEGFAKAKLFAFKNQGSAAFYVDDLALSEQA